MTRAAQSVADHATGRAMYLWVLAQNTAAQRFYQALGGTCVEQAKVRPPGGGPERLNGTPDRLRFAWPDAALVGPHRGG